MESQPVPVTIGGFCVGGDVDIVGSSEHNP